MNLFTTKIIHRKIILQQKLLVQKKKNEIFLYFSRIVEKIFINTPLLQIENV